MKKKTLPSKEEILLGTRIILAIKLKGWTQKEFAQKAGFEPYEVSRWTTGLYPPNALELKRIATVTSQPIDFFFKE